MKYKYNKLSVIVDALFKKKKTIMEDDPDPPSIGRGPRSRIPVSFLLYIRIIKIKFIKMLKGCKRSLTEVKGIQFSI